MKRLIVIVSILFTSQHSAQWEVEWTSSTNSSTYSAGWIYIFSNADRSYNYYKVDEISFRIMQSSVSESVLYSYNFTQEEIAAGNQIYSLGADLTGDDIVEFYVLAYHESEDNPRQSFKIIDITTGVILFERNEANSYYTYPVVWDVDNDSQLECSYAVYDYPDFVSYSYEVVNTPTLTSLNRDTPQANSFELMQNYPNPFNPVTNIRYNIPADTSKLLGVQTDGKEGAHVKIRIYDIAGRMIKTLVNQVQIPSSYNIEWDGTNQLGNRVSSGAYFYSLDTGVDIKTKKLMILK